MKEELVICRKEKKTKSKAKAKQSKQAQMRQAGPARPFSDAKIRGTYRIPNHDGIWRCTSVTMQGVTLVLQQPGLSPPVVTLSFADSMDLEKIADP